MNSKKTSLQIPSVNPPDWRATYLADINSDPGITTLYEKCESALPLLTIGITKEGRCGIYIRMTTVRESLRFVDYFAEKYKNSKDFVPWSEDILCEALPIVKNTLDAAVRMLAVSGRIVEQYMEPVMENGELSDIGYGIFVVEENLPQNNIEEFVRVTEYVLAYFEKESLGCYRIP